MSSVDVTLQRGEVISTRYPEPTTLPSWPTIDSANLAAVKTAKAGRALLPAGEFSLSGNADTNGMSLYAPLAHAVAGRGPLLSKIKVVPDSFKTAPTSAVKPAGDALLRFGPNNGSGGVQRSLSGLAFIGSDQHGPDGKEWLRTGIWNYYGKNDRYDDLLLQYLSKSAGLSPSTGETFAYNGFHDVGTYMTNVVISGLDPVTGKVLGGGLLNLANSVDFTARSCYFRDSMFSGVSCSVAGSAASPTIRPTFLDCLFERIANWPGGPSGSGFAMGVNFEEVLGQITAKGNTIVATNGSNTRADAPHFSQYGSTNNPVPALIEDTTVVGGPAWAKGALIYKLAGRQVTAPLVKRSGALLSPVVVPAGTYQANVDPTNQYILVAAPGYVMPV